METGLKDYLYCSAFIGLILGLTGLSLHAAQDWITGTLGPWAPIALFLLCLGLYGLLTAALLRLLFFFQPLREGDYAMDHPQFTLWKVQHVVGEMGKAALSLFFPVFLRAAFYAVFGARVGAQVAVAGKIIDPWLTELADQSILGEGCIVTSHAMVQDRFVLKRVRVGRAATVGVGSIIMPGVEIGDGAVVLPGSVLKSGTVVPPGELWGGVPAVSLRSTVKGTA